MCCVMCHNEAYSYQCVKYLIQRVVSNFLKYLYKRNNCHISSEGIVLCINLDTGWKGMISFTAGPLYPRKNIAPCCL